VSIDLTKADKAFVLSMIELGWVRSGTGVPSNSMGYNGNYYFRFDGTAAPTATKDHIYFKASNVWGGIA